ncbi:MAG: ABC transporter ATP-binding protein [Candidatus Njordarchaeota archaeon]
MTEPILIVKNLVVYFYTYAGVVKAVEGVSFKVYPGEVFGIVGETGCGKTVTSRAITRLIPEPGRIEGGEILFRKNSEWIDLLSLPDSELRKIRGNDIAYIFQDPSSSLDPLYMTGYQIGETIVSHRDVRWRDAWKKAVDILENVLIPDPKSRVKNYPHEMSGGMKQRVVIGISISNEPKILIADEPTTNVDVTIQAQLIDLLKRLKKERNTSIILITHNMGLIAEMADRVGVMYAGKMIEIASIDEIFNNPLHPYTRGLLKCVPNPLKKIDRLYSIPGMIPNLIYPPSGCRFHPRCEHAKPICKEKHPPTVEISPGHFVECWLYSEEGEEVSAK